MQADEEIQLLVARRGQIKAKITRFNNFLDENAQPDYTNLTIRLDKLKETYDSFDLTQERLEILQPTEPQHAIERENFENMYFQAFTRGSCVLQTLESLLQPQVKVERQTRETLPTKRLILPKIEIPKFSGELEKWIPFWDTFNSLVNKNASLDVIEKFYFLKSALHGQAKDIINSLELTVPNYDVAITLLCQRYKNRRAIIQRHIKLLFEEPQKVNKESSIAIKALLDSTMKHVRALQALQLNTDSWDALLIHMVAIKLDTGSLRAWELENVADTLPTFQQLCDFLQHRCDMLDAIQSKDKSQSQPSYKAKNASKTSFNTFALNTGKLECLMCKGQHRMFMCNAFKALSLPDRNKFITTHSCCKNCLNNTHAISNCKSSNCRICHKRHHTLLHNSQHVRHSNMQQPNLNDTVATQQSSSLQTNASTFTASTQYKQNLLPTASVLVKTSAGYKKCRALLDSASHSNFITQECATRLNLNLKQAEVSITSLNQNVTKAIFRTEINFMAVYDRNHTWKTDCLVVDHISSNIPPVNIQTQLDLSNHIKLADERFDQPSHVDILLGAELFWELLLPKVIKVDSNFTLRETKLGFIVTGSIHSQESTLSNFHLITNEKLSQQLKTFWEIEELPQKRLFTREEQSAETDFQNTVQRNPDGRYVVHIPRNHLANELGDSKAQAFKRFYSLETRLNKNHELKTLYSNFMQEYLNLGHMELANTQSVHTTHTSDQFYLPHHPVFKHDSSTTKLRVVFDGSAKSTSGLSLNDTLINGPVVQSELFDIMIRFRLSKFILTGDVEKMYRMIWVQSHQQSLQSILWRTNNDQPIQIYNLKTVTYGLHNSAYLATRTLFQLCNDQAHIFPRAATMVKHNTYVDDTLITANSESELVSLKQEIECMLLSAGFHMRKWCSNSKKVMNTIPPSERAKDKIFIPGKNETVKNLGTYWVPQTDTLQFKVNIQDREFTKRNILSEISKIYDILGLIGPVILKAKMFMQDLWSLSIGWDDILPDSQVTTWLNIKQDLLELSEFSISRPVSFQNRQIQVHVFADASEKAYGACLYVRSPYKDTYRVNLLSSKGKVSPLRKITLPRLELCAAVLAVKIADRIVDAMNLPIQSLTFWTDSKIVLAWLARSSATWQTFVANRVSIIQALSEIKQWKYISSAQNPADLISRGATSSMLQHSALWWHGPEFLLQHEEEWSQQPGESLQEIPEAKKNTMCLVSNTQDMYQRFSSFTKLIRVTAWCKRFIHNSRPSVQLKKRGQLSLEELDEATSRVIKIAQSESFQSEINSLKHDKDILKSSSIKSLDPYLDQHGLLRVGGRLHKAPLSMDQRHPVILSDKHPVSRLIVKQEHLSNIHTGAQTLLFLLRQKYWITNGRRLVNSVLKNCIVCFKNKPVSASQLMGQLPETRITPNRAFLYVGTDTAGPILLKSSQLRNAKLIKGYIAIFICFVTKAVHLEVVSDLTTEAFLAAFHRFVSRRGLCSHIFSDNAKTYISAAKELQQLHQSDKFKNQMHRRCTDMGITWHFTPPYGPHHGGLWESNIKIMKHHLNRIMGNLHYTYEQMSTLLTQIEAIMNSRPLSPLSNDHNDLLPLTPGHFLIGQALVSSHKADLTDIVQNKLSKWQHIQQSAQHFWHRWSKEYLNLLQPRKTWQNVQKNVQVGDLVLIKTDFSPPLKWNTGRIMEAHPGSDGLVRVVTVKTTQGIFRRPITKICLFPKEDV